MTPAAGSTMLLPLAPLQPWTDAVHLAPERCLLLDEDGRVLMLSASAARALGVDLEPSLGVPLLELLVDVTVDGSPFPDAALQAPPFRTLRSGHLARGLVRLRSRTYDVVSVPVAAGVLVHLHEL